MKFNYVKDLNGIRSNIVIRYYNYVYQSSVYVVSEKIRRLLRTVPKDERSRGEENMFYYVQSRRMNVAGDKKA